LAYSADVMFGAGMDMPKGIWLGGLYWFLANDSPANKSFCDAYLKRYKVFPDYNAHGGYAGVKAYAAAAQKAGSLDKEKIIAALEDLTIDLPVGTVIIRKEDHQAVQDCVWGMTAGYDGKMRFRSLKPLRIFPGSEVTPPVDQTGCIMRR
jgi:branched-chain amino acid transport system substrate-binding protein